MRLSSLIGVTIGAVVLSAPLLAQAPPAAPADKALQEQTQVTLVQVDAVVLDKSGRTVPGLTKGDFTLKIGGKPITITTIDDICPIGATADVAPIDKDPAKVPAPIAPGVKRRVVFAFDYTFLGVTMRPQVIDAASTMLKMFKTPDEEVMIVALTSDVRVEQKFTKDIRQLTAALSRMKHDVTLFARDYPLGSSGASYFENLSVLMDVLEPYDGGKAVVLFSQAGAIGSSMRDAYYDDVVAHASAGRAAIYPAKPDLLTSRGVSDSLSRLANQTGGRMPWLSNDLSLPYRGAQRDLSCRYTVAARVDPADSRSPRDYSLTLAKPELSVRVPERVQIFTDEAKKQSRARAAYVDPGPYEHPMVRAFAFSAVPENGSKWNTLLAVNFPAPVGAGGADIDVQAILRQGGMTVEDYKRRIHVDPAPGGAASRVVTLMGDTTLKAGQYDLTVVLNDAKGEKIVSAQTPLIVPQVIADLLTLRGPVMGRVVPQGMFLRGKPKEQAENTRLGKVLGEGNGFEPLLVGEIEKKDKLLFYWSACVYGTNPLPADVVVARKLLTAKGDTAHAYDPVPLKLASRGKDVSCLDMLETLPPNTLAPGEYQLDVTVARSNGEVVAHEAQPLEVH